MFVDELCVFLHAHGGRAWLTPKPKGSQYPGITEMNQTFEQAFSKKLKQAGGVKALVASSDNRLRYVEQKRHAPPFIALLMTCSEPAANVVKVACSDDVELALNPPPQKWPPSATFWSSGPRGPEDVQLSDSGSAIGNHWPDV